MEGEREREEGREIAEEREGGERGKRERRRKWGGGFKPHLDETCETFLLLLFCFFFFFFL